MPKYIGKELGDNSDLQGWLFSVPPSRRDLLFAKVFEQVKELRLPFHDLQKCVLQLTQNTSVPIEKCDFSKLEESPKTIMKRQQRVNQIVSDSESDDDSSNKKSASQRPIQNIHSAKKLVSCESERTCIVLDEDDEDDVLLVEDIKTPLVIDLLDSDVEDTSTLIVNKNVSRKRKFSKYFDSDSDEETDINELAKKHINSRGRTILLEKYSLVDKRCGKYNEMCSLCEVTPWSFPPYRSVNKKVDKPKEMSTGSVASSHLPISQDCKNPLDSSVESTNDNSICVPTVLDCNINRNKTSLQVKESVSIEFASVCSSENNRSSTLEEKLLSKEKVANSTSLELLNNVNTHVGTCSESSEITLDDLKVDYNESCLSEMLEIVKRDSERIPPDSIPTSTIKSISDEGKSVHGSTPDVDAELLRGNEKIISVAEHQQEAIVSSSGIPVSPQDSSFVPNIRPGQIWVKDKRTLGIPDDWGSYNSNTNVSDQEPTLIDTDVKKNLDYIIAFTQLCAEEFAEKHKKIRDAQKEPDVVLRKMKMDCIQKQNQAVCDILYKNVHKYYNSLRSRITSEENLFHLLIKKWESCFTEESPSPLPNKEVEKVFKFCLKPTPPIEGVNNASLEQQYSISRSLGDPAGDTGLSCSMKETLRKDQGSPLISQSTSSVSTSQGSCLSQNQPAESSSTEFSGVNLCRNGAGEMCSATVTISASSGPGIHEHLSEKQDQTTFVSQNISDQLLIDPQAGRSVKLPGDETQELNEVHIPEEPHSNQVPPITQQQSLEMQNSQTQANNSSHSSAQRKLLQLLNINQLQQQQSNLSCSQKNLQFIKKNTAILKRYMNLPNHTLRCKYGDSSAVQQESSHVQLQQKAKETPVNQTTQQMNKHLQENLHNNLNCTNDVAQESQQLERSSNTMNQKQHPQNVSVQTFHQLESLQPIQIADTNKQHQLVPPNLSIQEYSKNLCNFPEQTSLKERPLQPIHDGHMQNSNIQSHQQSTRPCPLTLHYQQQVINQIPRNWSHTSQQQCLPQKDSSHSCDNQSSVRHLQVSLHHLLSDQHVSSHQQTEHHSSSYQQAEKQSSMYPQVDQQSSLHQRSWEQIPLQEESQQISHHQLPLQQTTLTQNALQQTLVPQQFQNSVPQQRAQQSSVPQQNSKLISQFKQYLQSRSQLQQGAVIRQNLKQSSLPQYKSQQISLTQNSAQQNSLPQNSVQQNSLPQNSVQQNSLPQNSVQQNSLPQNSVQQNSLPQNSVQQNSLPQYSVQQNSLPQNSVQQTPLHQNSVQQSSMPLNSVQQCSLPQYSVQQSSMPLNSVQQCSLPQYSVQQSSLPYYSEHQSSLPQYSEHQSSLPQQRAQQSSVPQQRAQQSSQPQYSGQQCSLPQYSVQQCSVSQYSVQQSLMPEYSVQQGSVFQYSEQRSSLAQQRAQQSSLAQQKAQQSSLAQQRAQQSSLAQQRAQQSSLAQQRAQQSSLAQQRAQQSSLAQQKAQQSSLAQHRAQQSSLAQQRAQQSSLAQQRAQQSSLAQQRAQQSSLAQQRAQQSSLAQQKVQQSSLAQQRAQQSSLAQQKAQQSSLAQQRAQQSSLAQQRAQQSSLAQQRAQQSSLAQQKVQQSSLAQQRAQQSSLAQQKAQQSSLAQQRAQQSSLAQQRAQQSSLAQQRAQQSSLAQQRAQQSSLAQQRAQQSCLAQQRAQQSSLAQQRVEESSLPQQRAQEISQPQQRAQECSLPQQRAHESSPSQQKVQERLLPQQRVQQSLLPQQCLQQRSQSNQGVIQYVVSCQSLQQPLLFRGALQQSSLPQQSGLQNLLLEQPQQTSLNQQALQQTTDNQAAAKPTLKTYQATHKRKNNQLNTSSHSPELTGNTELTLSALLKSQKIKDRSSFPQQTLQQSSLLQHPQQTSLNQQAFQQTTDNQAGVKQTFKTYQATHNRSKNQVNTSSHSPELTGNTELALGPLVSGIFSLNQTGVEKFQCQESLDCVVSISSERVCSSNKHQTHSGSRQQTLDAKDAGSGLSESSSVSQTSCTELSTAGNQRVNSPGGSSNAQKSSNSNLCSSSPTNNTVLEDTKKFFETKLSDEEKFQELLLTKEMNRLLECSEVRKMDYNFTSDCDSHSSTDNLKTSAIQKETLNEGVSATSQEENKERNIGQKVCEFEKNEKEAVEQQLQLEVEPQKEMTNSEVVPILQHLSEVSKQIMENLTREIQTKDGNPTNVNSASSVNQAIEKKVEENAPNEVGVEGTIIKCERVDNDFDECGTIEKCLGYEVDDMQNSISLSLSEKQHKSSNGANKLLNAKEQAPLDKRPSETKHPEAFTYSSEREVVCAVCQKEATVVCSQCQAICYCSDKCQIVHWHMLHHLECMSVDS